MNQPPASSSSRLRAWFRENFQPRFTPPPGDRQYSVLGRLFVVGAVCFGGLGILLTKLYYEQVVRHEYWAGRISKGSEVTVRIPATRGNILDRNGRVLAENRASYAVEFYLPDIVRNYREEHKKVPVVEYYATVKQMKKVLQEADIVQIVNETVVPQLRQLGLAADYNATSLQRHYRNKAHVPFIYRDDVDFSVLANYVQHGTGIPGVELVKKPVRTYPLGALGTHLVGYIGAVKDVSREPDIDDFTFYEPDLEGKAQVERYCDKWLRGTAGVRVLWRNSKGVIEGERQRIDPKPGNNVYLTIDARIQSIVERALRDAGIGRGAAVVVDPSTGEVLAMASVPSYDPNVFIPSVSAEDWKRLTSDPTDPLTNRAVQGYAPGSIFKVVTALSGLRAGLSPNRTFTCSGGVQYGSKYMKCWIAGRGSHGALTLPIALEQSCNAFFYQWGNAASIQQIDAMGDALGLGKKTGIPLSGESGGVMPGPTWLQSNHPGERWSDGHTANVSIGQGYVLTSPLQMAMVTAAIANRRFSYEPRLLLRAVDSEGKDVHDPDTGQLAIPQRAHIRADLRQAGIDDSRMEAVREGMRLVVADGTGKRAQITGVSVAGKTGTAQFWRGDIKDNHAWFITFAPYESPRFAICVLIQGGKSGGGVAGPVARRIMEQCLALGHGEDPPVVAMTPAVGSFAAIDAVDYKTLPSSPTVVTSTKPAPSVPIARAVPVGRAVPFDELDDPETLDALDAPTRATAVEPFRYRQPAIRPLPDSRGSVWSHPERAPAPRNDVLKPFFAPPN